MRRVYIGLQPGGGGIGWLIRLVTRSRYGHALIAFDDAAFSADGKKGWGFLRVGDIKTPTRWYYFEASDDQLRQMKLWCIAKAGAKYDWASVIRFTTVWRLFFNSRERRRDRRRLFCSEGVYRCAQDAGISLLGEIAAWEVAPGHFRFSSKLHYGGPPTYRGPVL